MGFAENLRTELDYQGLFVKQLAAKADINIHTLNHYLSGNKSMPPADVAVRIAAALGVTVEYLVTGRHDKQAAEALDYLRFRAVIDNLRILPKDMVEIIQAMIETAAVRERAKKKKALPDT